MFYQQRKRDWNANVIPKIKTNLIVQTNYKVIKIPRLILKVFTLNIVEWLTIGPLINGKVEQI